MGGRLQVEEETRTEWMAPGRVGSMSLRGVYHCGLAGGAPALPSADRGEGGGGEWTDAQVLVAGVYGGDGGEEDRFAGTNGGVPKEDSEGGGCGGGGVILRKGGGGVPLSLLRSLARRSENFGDGGGVDLMKGATCGVGVVKVLILTAVACGLWEGEGGEAFLTAVAPLVGAGFELAAGETEMLSSCCSSRQILWMSLSMSRSVLSVLGSFLRLIPPPLLCRSLAGFGAGLGGGGGALKWLSREELLPSPPPLP